MRLVVTGRQGQVATALRERAAAAGDVEVVALGRPAFDLEIPATIVPALIEARPDAIVSAAAYTAVDKAESERDRAFAVNAAAPGLIAGAAAELGVPIIHLSTDYVFDGTKSFSYVEDDPTGPLGVYGASKLGGEHAVAAATSNYAILRTAWVYSPFGANFLKTMLRLAASRDVIGVVSDQEGNPTSALDIADGVIAIARDLAGALDDGTRRGVFHMAGTGDATWATFAAALLAASARQGGPTATIRPITTAEYPTPAPRPANSRLDCARLEAAFGVRLPDWRRSMEAVVARLHPAGETA